jgi:hypothetical protein
MAKKLQLSIAEPCHENWESMSPVEKGKFCGSCQKQVVDFSNMSDRDIAEFFKKPSTGSVCGRFMTDQLERDILIPKKRIPWLRLFFQVMLPAFFISKASAQQKIGKVNPVNRDTTRVPIGHEFRTLGMVLPMKITPVCKDTLDNRLVKGEINVVKKVNHVQVNGKVVDEKGEPIPGASIRIVNSEKMIVADGSGKFSFQNAKEQLIELELTSVGYQTEHYIYPFTLDYSAVVDISIQMKTKSLELKEIVITYITCGQKKDMLMGAIAYVKGDTIAAMKPDSVKISKQPDPFETNKILVYPNPVSAGSTINIGFDKMEEGYYALQLLSLSGSLVSQKEIWIDAEARAMGMVTPQVAADSYFLLLINKKTGKKFTEKIIIQ